VGRDKSIKAVSDAYKADKLIGVIAQKDSAVEEPTVSDLEEIGTVAKIAKLIKMPDGGTTIIIQGRKRFKIDEVTTEDPYFKAKIQTLEEEMLVNDNDFNAMVGGSRTWRARSYKSPLIFPVKRPSSLKTLKTRHFSYILSAAT
jgi:ATP-dependent Lon protease